jgi:NTE family protein
MMINSVTPLSSEGSIPNSRVTGLALGSGAARGFAHIGVLDALEECNIRIDLLAGTSIGALIGALYASGLPVSRLQEVASDLNWRKLAGMLGPSIPTSGLLDSRKVSRFIKELLPVKTFEELSIPLAVTTTDIESGELIVIRQGLLLPAILAAISFPGLFSPVRVGDRFLVDGGLCSPVPTDVVRQMGAEIIIGVCAIPEVDKRYNETFAPDIDKTPAREPLLKRFTPDWVERTFSEIWSSQNHSDTEDATNDKKNPPGLFRIFAQSIAILENQINSLRLEQENVDFLIRPELKNITLLEFHKAADAIAAGRHATLKLFKTKN